MTAFVCTALLPYVQLLVRFIYTSWWNTYTKKLPF